MINIDLKFKNEFLKLEIIDNSIGKFWSEHIQNLGICTARAVSFPHYIDPSQHLEKINSTWNNIKKNIDIIKSEFNIDWPEQVPEVFNFDQQILNRYHRYFAQSTMFYNRWLINSQYTFQEIPKENRKRFEFLLEEINAYIHTLESYTYTEVVNKYQNRLKKIHFNFENKLWKNIPEGTKHTLNPELNVCLAMEVHGKNYLQAFMDDDDPTQVDVHGHRGLFGFVDIYIDDSVFEILNSKEFKKWLNCGNIKDLGLIQLGRVIESSDSLKNIYQKVQEPAPVNIVQICH